MGLKSMGTRRNSEKMLKRNKMYLNKAFEALAGGQSELARRLSEETYEQGDKQTVIRPGTVHAWYRRDKYGVPTEFLAAVERITGVAREDLRGDIPWR